MSHAAGEILGSTLNRQLIQRWLIVVIAYYISGRLGLAAPSIGKDVTLIWLPTGIAVAACPALGLAYGLRHLVRRLNCEFGGRQARL